MALTYSRPAVTSGKPVHAAGAVLWRQGPAGLEVALIHRPRYDDWSLPKGKVDHGEHTVLTAVREVFEETGRRVVLGRRLPSISYRVLGGTKRVRYWAGRALPESDEDAAFQPNHEVDQIDWLRPQAALDRLTRPLDATVLASFMRARVDTVPIVLLRHGTAEKRGPEYPDDQIRPLAAVGHWQSEILSSVLPCFGALQVITSPAVRCVDTVRPFARKQQTIINTEATLSEEAHAADHEAAASWLRALITKGEPALVCSHREVLDSMLASVLDEAAEEQAAPRSMNGRAWSKRQVDRLLGADRSGGRLKPGRGWILHVTPGAGEAEAPRLVAVDRLKP
ncbi:NUDIX domain-containing protein [Actinocrinis sp.]|uniref:NUDIX domain-containing protein n=1 Tax=Actinocrinis sp. TaxID=1920516 RepID=UPI002D437B2F|nr:NUDIX domain-containing protein [Actinocrinis sp.]HZP52460.1 NUDIX domain-containing protein [Actinocrinis sp.]